MSVLDVGLFTLAGFLILVLLFCVYMLIRNEWVFKKKMWWNEKVHRANRNFIRSGEALEQGVLPDWFKWPYDGLFDYGKMMSKFWCWDVNKMIADEEAYDFVVKWDYDGQNSPGNERESS